MVKNIKSWLILLLFLLQGCSSESLYQKTLLDKTALKLEKTHKISNAELIIRYELSNKNTASGIYAINYPLIINDKKYNKQFLQNFKSVSLIDINNQSIKKLHKLKKLFLKLDGKHHFLSKNEIGVISHQNNSANTLTELLKIDKISSSIPLMSPQYKSKVTSHYGVRFHPILKCKKSHCGIDMQGVRACGIYSSADGIVVKISDKGSYGNMIEIEHSRKFRTKYCHLKKIFAREGQAVKQGQIIGLQGCSGMSTREHLHFEILLRGVPINPFDFISHSCI